MTKPPLRILLISMGDLTTNLILSPILDLPGVEVIGLTLANTLSGKKKGVSAALALLKKMDLRYWAYLAYINGWYKVFTRLGHPLLGGTSTMLIDLQRRCRDMGIPIFTPTSVNSEIFVQQVRDLRPDLIVLRVNQILKQPLLEIPRLGVWCVHSSLLPAYKGIAAEFQALREDVPILGSSVFEVRLKLDEGPVVSQVAFSPSPNASLFQHTLYNNVVAGQLLRQTIDYVVHTGTIPYQTLQTVSEGTYYSWPQPSQVNEFLSKGHTLMHPGEVLTFPLHCLLAKPDWRFPAFEDAHTSLTVPVPQVDLCRQL